MVENKREVDGADRDAVAGAMHASEEGGLRQPPTRLQSSWTSWKRKVHGHDALCKLLQ